MLAIYVHRMKSDDRKIIDKMMESVNIKDYDVIDLAAVSYQEEPRAAITIGNIAARVVKRKLHAFPDFSVFTGALTDEKKLTRKKVFEALQKLADEIENYSEATITVAKVDESIFEKPQTMEELKRMWYSQNDGRITHMIVNSANKKICIYNGDKPSVNADMFYTVAEFAALLDLMERFGAKNILIYREGKMEGNEI